MLLFKLCLFVVWFVFGLLLFCVCVLFLFCLICVCCVFVSCLLVVCFVECLVVFLVDVLKVRLSCSVSFVCCSFVLLNLRIVVCVFVCFTVV